MAKQCELLATHTRGEMSLCNHYLVHQNLNSSFVFAPIHPHSKGQTMKTLTCNEIQTLMRKAKTLEQSHALAVLYVQTLKEKYKGEKFTCYKPKGQS
jgi:hypothetical protein